MELCESVEKTFLGSILGRQEIEQGRGLLIEKKLACAEPKVQIRVQVEFPADELSGGSPLYDERFTRFVDQHLTVSIKLEEPKGQQPIFFDLIAKRIRFL